MRHDRETRAAPAVPQRSAARAVPSGPAARILALQRTAGNAAVSRALLQRTVTVTNPSRTVNEISEVTANSLEQNFGASREAIALISEWALSPEGHGPFATWHEVVAAAEQELGGDGPGFAPSSDEVVFDASDIANHFIKSFKTVLIAKIEGVGDLGRFYNDTGADQHAEDGLMAAIYARLDELQKIKRKKFANEPMVLSVRINNSPCMRCAEGLVELIHHTPIDAIEFEAANIYTDGGPEAIEYMEGHGITVDWLDIEMALAMGGVDVEAFAKRLGGTLPKRLDARRRKTERTKEQFAAMQE